MPLTVTEVGEITEAQKIWLNAPTLVTTWLGRDLTDTQWDAALDIEFAGANYIQVLFWAQKTIGSETTMVDIEIHARSQATSALLPVLIGRVIWGPEDDSFFVASGSRPINDAAIDLTDAWHLATKIDLTEPRNTTYPWALNTFGAKVFQQRSLGPLLQIPTRGWTEFMMRAKQVQDGLNPAKFLSIYHER